MVCCYCGRDLVYFTFGDDELRDQIFEIYSFLKDKEITVGEYFQFILKFSKKS